MLISRMKGVISSSLKTASGGAFGRAILLQWLPTTQLQVVAIDHEFYSHVLINQSDGSKVGVIQADADWPAQQVQWHLRKG
jgi:phospholipid N-methyltransferase